MPALDTFSADTFSADTSTLDTSSVDISSFDFSSIDFLRPRLVGRRVTLRAIEPADAPALVAASHDLEARRLAGVFETCSIDEMETHCRLVRSATDRVDYAITCPPDARLRGEATLNMIDWDQRSANFRIMLADASIYDQGLGTEASRLLIEHGFVKLRLNRIELEVFDFNDRARHVYAKLGFVLEGRRRAALRLDGRFHDSLMMAMLASDFEAGWHRLSTMRP